MLQMTRKYIICTLLRSNKYKYLNIRNRVLLCKQSVLQPVYSQDGDRFRFKSPR